MNNRGETNLGYHTIRIVNIYGPNNQKDGIQYFESLYQALETEALLSIVRHVKRD